MSHSMYRRRRWRTLAATLALTLGSLAIPAAALADGQLDPTFNGTGYHVGTVAEGTVFNNTDTRIPMIVQANGSVVIGGSRGGFMTLARYTPGGALDTSFGVNGFATAQFAGTAGSAPGNSGATAMTQDAGGNIIVAGFGASQSMVAARFTANGAFSAAAVCFAPHLIDYTARAVSVRPNASVVLVGYARDRWPTVAVPPTAAVLYGQRAVVTLPANGVSATACGSTAVPEQGSAGVQIDGLLHDGTVTDATLAGRYYEGVAALPDNRYVVATTNGPDANVAAGNAAWLLRFPAAGAGLDTTFNPLGAGSIVPVAGRLPIQNVNLHAIKLQGTDAYAAGETLGGTADARRMLAARVDTNGALVGGFGAGGIAQAKVSGGNNTGQALIFQATNVIVGGGANLAGKSAFGMTRFNAQTGAHDPGFGPSGQVVTPFGAPAVNGYITGMALSPQGMIDVSGRLTDPAGLATVAARYFAVGSPPPLPLPAASTMGADQVTGTSARISGIVNTNGSASTWWIEYGTTTAYGAHTVRPGPSGITGRRQRPGHRLRPCYRHHLSRAHRHRQRARLGRRRRRRLHDGRHRRCRRRGRRDRRCRDRRQGLRRRHDARNGQEEDGRQAVHRPEDHGQDDQQGPDHRARQGLQVQGDLQEVAQEEGDRPHDQPEGRQEAHLPRAREDHGRQALLSAAR